MVEPIWRLLPCHRASPVVVSDGFDWDDPPLEFSKRSGMLADFPMRALEAGIEGTWHRSAVRINENWLHDLKPRTEQRKATIAIARPRRNEWRSGGIRSAVD